MDSDTLIFDNSDDISHIDMNSGDDTTMHIEDASLDFGDADDFMVDDKVPVNDDDSNDEDFKLDNSDASTPLVGILKKPKKGATKDPDYDSHKLGSKKRKRVRMSLLPVDGKVNESFVIEENDAIENAPIARVPGTFGRRGRRKGDTLPAYHKRVTHELDDDDKLMLEMREKGFSDRQIADKLAVEGGVRYDVKSISTRIGRIRLALADYIDWQIKEGIREWTFEDDCVLMQAYALADIEVNYEIERIRAWRFRKVAEYMRRLNKNMLFSANSCADRYRALMAGTARIPCDVDDDPVARRAEMEAVRKERATARAKEEEEKQAKLARDRKAKEEAKRRNALRAEAAANKRAQEEVAKAQRLMQRAAQAQVRAARATENQNAKKQRNAQLKAQGSKLAGTRRLTSTTTPSIRGALPQFVTVDTPDPRLTLSLYDVTSMAEERGIAVADMDKTQIVQAMVDADNDYSIAEMKKMCERKGLPTTGTKPILRYRLARHAAEQYASFGLGDEVKPESEGNSDLEENGQFDENPGFDDEDDLVF